MIFIRQFSGVLDEITSTLLEYTLIFPKPSTLNLTLKVLPVKLILEVYKEFGFEDYSSFITSKIASNCFPNSKVKYSRIDK